MRLQRRPGAIESSHVSARIESTRALAALGVLVYHLQVTAHGYDGNWSRLALGTRALMFGQFGVAVFFALSGYLLFRPFARAAIIEGRVDLRRYIVSRVLRILPLYYAAVGLLLFIQPAHQLTWDQVWRHLLFVQYLDTKIPLVDFPLWSLVCEVGFYTLLPFLGWSLARLSRGSSVRALCVVILFGLGAWLLSAVAARQTPYVVWNFSLPANLIYFVPGMLIATVEGVVNRGAVRLPNRGASTACLSIAAAVSWVLMLPGPTSGGVLVAAGLTLAAVVASNSAFPGRRRRYSPLPALGLRSYSLYVWHLPIVTALAGAGWLNGSMAHDAAVAVPLCLAVAVLSYAVIEAPCMRLRRWVVPGTTEQPPLRTAVRSVS